MRNVEVTLGILVVLSTLALVVIYQEETVRLVLTAVFGPFVL